MPRTTLTSDRSASSPPVDATTPDPALKPGARGADEQAVASHVRGSADDATYTDDGDTDDGAGVGANDDTRSGRRRGRRQATPVDGATTVVEAATAEEAIAEVHATYGVRARIIDARLVRSGGVGGFFAREVVQLHVAPPSADDATSTASAGRSAADLADLRAPDPDARLDGAPPPNSDDRPSEPGDRPRSPVDRLLGDDRILDAEGDGDFAALLAQRYETAPTATPRRTPHGRTPRPAPAEEPVRPSARDTARALARELAIAAREDAVTAGRAASRRAVAAPTAADAAPATGPAPVADAPTAAESRPAEAPLAAEARPAEAPPATEARPASEAPPAEAPLAAEAPPAEAPLAAEAPPAEAPLAAEAPPATDTPMPAEAPAASLARALHEGGDDRPVRWPTVDVDEAPRVRGLPAAASDVPAAADEPGPEATDVLSDAAAALLTDPSTLWAASAEALRRSESARLVRERAEAEAREWTARLALTDPPPADVISVTDDAAPHEDDAAPAASVPDIAPEPATAPTTRRSTGPPPDQLPSVAPGEVAWTATGLLRLGLPGEVVHGLQVDEPHDDLAWTAALTASLRSLCRPLPAGDSVLVGPLVTSELSDAAQAPAARSSLFLEALRDRRWVHLVVGGDGWRDRLDDEPLAVSWARPEDLPDAIRSAAELGLVLGYGPMGGKVRRARPMDVALAIRELVDER